MTLTEFSLYFSYSQFMVYDKSEAAPGCDWTETHTRQGFARRESTVCFATVLEFGDADVRVHLGEYTANQADERVIVVPFYSPTGQIVVEGPEEDEVSDRDISIAPGHYNLLAAQRVVDDEEEVIDLYFQKLGEPAKRSKVLMADEELDPPAKLLEDAAIA